MKTTILIRHAIYFAGLSAERRKNISMQELRELSQILVLKASLAIVLEKIASVLTWICCKRDVNKKTRKIDRKVSLHVHWSEQIL